VRARLHNSHPRCPNSGVLKILIAYHYRRAGLDTICDELEDALAKGYEAVDHVSGGSADAAEVVCAPQPEHLLPVCQLRVHPSSWKPGHHLAFGAVMTWHGDLHPVSFVHA
jgi:hypothetical protein